MAEAKKKIISHILEEQREWVPAAAAKPRYNQQVVMRLYNPNIIYRETETEIYPSEDIKIGRYARGYGEGGSWYVDPPFPRFDYSPLTNKESLNEGTVVTHWAIPSKKEIEAWNDRFSQINLFRKLKLEVDEEHEEDVYRALMFGAAYIQNMLRLTGEDNPEAVRLATILYDLQYVLDSRKPIDLSEEEYEALVKERAKAAEEDELEDKD